VKKKYDFKMGKKSAVLPVAAGKARITIRIDNDVLAWFREQVHAAEGGNYQTLINVALRDHVESQRELLEMALRQTRAYERARRRALRDLRKPRDLGAGARTTWTPDELHERHPVKKAK